MRTDKGRSQTAIKTLHKSYKAATDVTLLSTGSRSSMSCGTATAAEIDYHTFLKRSLEETRTKERERKRNNQKHCVTRGLLPVCLFLSYRHE